MQLLEHVPRTDLVAVRIHEGHRDVADAADRCLVDGHLARCRRGDGQRRDVEVRQKSDEFHDVLVAERGDLDVVLAPDVVQFRQRGAHFVGRGIGLDLDLVAGCRQIVGHADQLRNIAPGQFTDELDRQNLVELRVLLVAPVGRLGVGHLDVAFSDDVLQRALRGCGDGRTEGFAPIGLTDETGQRSARSRGSGRADVGDQERLLPADRQTEGALVSAALHGGQRDGLDLVSRIAGQDFLRTGLVERHLVDAGFQLAHRDAAGVFNRLKAVQRVLHPLRACIDSDRAGSVAPESQPVGGRNRRRVQFDLLHRDRRRVARRHRRDENALGPLDRDDVGPRVLETQRVGVVLADAEQAEFFGRVERDRVGPFGLVLGHAQNAARVLHHHEVGERVHDLLLALCRIRALERDHGSVLATQLKPELVRVRRNRDDLNRLAADRRAARHRNLVLEDRERGRALHLDRLDGVRPPDILLARAEQVEQRLLDQSPGGDRRVATPQREVKEGEDGVSVEQEGVPEDFLEPVAHDGQVGQGDLLAQLLLDRSEERAQPFDEYLWVVADLVDHALVCGGMCLKVRCVERGEDLDRRNIRKNPVGDIAQRQQIHLEVRGRVEAQHQVVAERNAVLFVKDGQHGLERGRVRVERGQDRIHQVAVVGVPSQIVKQVGRRDARFRARVERQDDACTDRDGMPFDIDIRRSGIAREPVRLGARAQLKAHPRAAVLRVGVDEGRQFRRGRARQGQHGIEALRHAVLRDGQHGDAGVLARARIGDPHDERLRPRALDLGGPDGVGAHVERLNRVQRVRDLLRGRIGGDPVGDDRHQPAPRGKGLGLEQVVLTDDLVFRDAADHRQRGNVGSHQTGEMDVEDRRLVQPGRCDGDLDIRAGDGGHVRQGGRDRVRCQRQAAQQRRVVDEPDLLGDVRDIRECQRRGRIPRHDRNRPRCGALRDMDQRLILGVGAEEALQPGVQPFDQPPGDVRRAKRDPLCPCRPVDRRQCQVERESERVGRGGHAARVDHPRSRRTVLDAQDRRRRRHPVQRKTESDLSGVHVVHGQRHALEIFARRIVIRGRGPVDLGRRGHADGPRHMHILQLDARKLGQRRPHRGRRRVHVQRARRLSAKRQGEGAGGRDRADHLSLAAVDHGPADGRHHFVDAVDGIVHVDG